MHTPIRNTSHRGFTLLDLLIGLAVTSVVAATLFPTLSLARNSRVASCLSTKRQISEAAYMYALDHDGTATKISNNLMPYEGVRSFDGFACPLVNSVRPMAGSNLNYGGGHVETTPAVYLVFWGSQWSSDPSNEAGILQSFFNGVGGSAWANTDTQYTSNYGNAGNQTNELAGVWFDNAGTAPKHPTQSQLAGEASRAASHFGSSGNINAQYVIATSHGHNASGFGTQYCAWHSSTGNISYTNLPYITDAGASCGANFNGLGPNAGITIVAGHEFSETVTDPFPSSGWVDSSGAEIGDKCAWASNTNNTTFSTGTFPVQPLWSNASSSCVLHYP